MTTDADRLAADGIPITLADGIHHLRFTMRGLKMLEDSFDGIDNVTKFLAGTNRRRFGPLADMLAAGLVHDGITADAVLDLAPPQRYTEYLSAAIDALDVAFPSPAEEEAEPRPKDPATNGSTGEASTTSPPSSSAAAMATSGP